MDVKWLGVRRARKGIYEVKEQMMTGSEVG